jgi:hypothetical protein
MRATINRVGKYELKAVLARTALSTVYDGWDSDIARRVAIKMMPLSTSDDDEAREALGRFKRGAQAAGQLNHPNIVAVYDYGETADYAYLVMEFIDGPTLKALFDKNQRFSVPEIGSVVGGILDALQYSHDRRVVHRDMKPANVMFTKSNVVKITDFGIARLEDSEMTQAGMVIGTPAYMSPEQFLGDKIDWRTDIYSTGVLLYHILTGERPYEGTLATIMHKVLYGSPLLPSRLSTQVTSALDQVVTRAMAKKREDRFESCTQFKAELLRALASPGGKGERVVPPAEQPRRPISRPAGEAPPRFVATAVAAAASRKVMIASLAGVVLAAGGGVVAWRMHGKPAAVATADRAPDRSKDFVAPPPADVAEAPSPGGPNAQVQPPNFIYPDNSAAVTPPVEPVVPESRPADQRDPAPGVQEQPASPRYEAKRTPDVADPPRYDPPSTPAYPPPVRNTPEKKPIPPPGPVAKGGANDRNAPPTGPDRRPPPADGKTGKPGQDFATRTNPPNEPPGEDTADALRRLRNGNRPVPPSETLQPPPTYAITSSSAVGLVCQSITPDTAGQFGLDSARGMVVTGVATGSAAATAGIRRQDVILKINGTEVRDLSVLPKIAGETPAGGTVPVEIRRGGSQQVVQLLVDKLRH